MLDMPKTAKDGFRTQVITRNSNLPKTEESYGQNALSMTKTMASKSPVRDHIKAVDERSEMCVSDILRHSTQLVSLKYDHMSPDKCMQNARKLGLLSGTKQAIAQGITT